MKKMVLWAAVLAMFASTGSAQNYAPVGDKIKTEWAKSVNPKDVWNVYPRPLMVRGEWQNINGLWNYAITDNGKATP